MISRKPTHPGKVLFEDVIKPLGLRMTEAARDLGVTRKKNGYFRRARGKTIVDTQSRTDVQAYRKANILIAVPECKSLYYRGFSYVRDVKVAVFRGAHTSLIRALYYRINIIYLIIMIFEGVKWLRNQSALLLMKTWRRNWLRLPRKLIERKATM